MEFLSPLDINLSMYNDSAIQTLGTCVILLVSPIDGCIYDTKFYVAQHSGSVLFSCEGSLYLQLIQPHPVLSKHMPHGANIIRSKHDLAYINFVTRNKQASHYQPKQSSVPCTLKEVNRKYADVFDGLGRFPGKPYHINLNPEVPPKWVPCRPVPVHHQEEFKKQLTEMQQAGVLVPVNQSTPCISSYVNVKSEDTKGGKKFCIGLDLRNVNKAILCEPFFTCTPNDVYAKLSKAKTLTVIDFKKGFWQVELDEESSYLMTFNTPFGCFRFTCLPLGLIVSGDVFQHKLDVICGHLLLTIGCADDRIVLGEKDDLSDHDKALDKFLQVT